MDIVVSDIATRLVKNEDDDGDVTYAIKASVENHSDDESVWITLQAVDADEFEVGTAHREGTVPRGGKRTLTTQSFMNGDAFRRIVRWQTP